MRKELYLALCERLKGVGDGVIKHIDLWNRNVEFIDEEESWGRPAVFVEFCAMEWKPIVRGVEYRADPLVKLHVVTDWGGGAADGCEFEEDSLGAFGLSKEIHAALCGMSGTDYDRLDLVCTETNHDHEEIVENIETYQCVAWRRLG